MLSGGGGGGGAGSPGDRGKHKGSHISEVMLDSLGWSTLEGFKQERDMVRFVS